MSIFIDPNDTFEIRLRILQNKTRLLILDENDEREGSYLLICKATGRDFDNMSHILENTTVINHINGDRLLRSRILFKQIILRFFKSWNLLDENQNIIPITEEILGRMNYKLVTALAKKWIRETR